jgi:membrane fusion protein, copper/silver efflux system
MTTKTKRLLVATVGALALAITLGLVLVRGRGDEPHAGSGTPGAPSAMADMPGMGGPVGSEAAATVTPAQLRQFGITFGTVERRPLEQALRATGVIVPDETRLAEVAPRVGGVVERLHASATGERVARGAPLLELYAPDVMAAEAELLVAARLDRELGPDPIPGAPAAGSDGHASLVAAARRRLQLWGVSDREIDAVLREGHARRTVTLFSPIAGIVLDKPVQRGQTVAAGQTLYRLADLSRVWLEVEVREADAAALQPGAAVQVDLSAYPGRPASGRVDYVYPVLDTMARTVRARVALANPDGRLKPGMYATARLAGAGRDALTAPSSAVVHTGERDLVFVDQGGGRLASTEVVLGRRGGDYTEVLSGLEPGQRVVTSAQYLLESESNLSEVMRGMISQTGSGEMSGPAMQEMPGMNAKGADLRDAARAHENTHPTPTGGPR